MAEAMVMTISTTGAKQEVVFEEEDGITMIFIKDWNTGEVIAETEFNGTIEELKERLS